MTIFLFDDSLRRRAYSLAFEEITSGDILSQKLKKVQDAIDIR